MKPKRHNTKRKRGGLIAKIRKPMAPPTRVEPDVKQYRRSRERALVRRETERS